MKYVSLFIVIDLIFVVLFTAPKLEVTKDYFCLEDIVIHTAIEDKRIDTVETLLNAIIQVESRGKDSCVGDRHLGRPSIGCLQIRPVMVKEVNRILKKEKKERRFTLDDRWSREKSIEMFYVWQEYHHSEDSLEAIARCWNGGPRGYKRKATKHYWGKVQKELNIIQNEMDI